MALSTRIVTRHTTLFAALIAAAVLGLIWVVAALASLHTIETHTHDARQLGVSSHAWESRPARAAIAFAPATVRPSDRLCGWTADQIHRHHHAITPESRELHGRAIVGLTEAYLDMRCPSRIHDGNWDVTAEILGVGLVGETIEEQVWFTTLGLDFDRRAENLVPVATSTFEILAPHRMCRDAVHGDPRLGRACVSALGWFD